MDDNNSQNVNSNNNLSEKQKANQAGKNIAETAARGLGKAYGGKVGEKAIKFTLKTKGGERVVNNAGKKLSMNPVTRKVLARHHSGIGGLTQGINSIMGGSTSNSSSESRNEGDNSILSDSDNKSNNIKGDGFVKGIWKKLPLKVKLIALGCIASFVSSIIFLIILITPLMELGIIDISGSGSSGGGSSVTPSGGYTSVSDNSSHWIPIGSSTTSVVNGVTYASGSPQTSAITSYFYAQEGFRTKAHGGIDFGNGGNGPGVINIIASKDGTVVYPTSSDQIMYEDNGYYGNRDGQGFGNFVKIEHSDGTATIYAHLSKNSITVFSGQTVKQGQVIGKMGHSGSSTGTHLHFEVRVNNNRVDPLNYVSVSNPRP